MTACIVYREKGTTSFAEHTLQVYSGNTYRYYWDPLWDGKTFEYYIKVAQQYVLPQSAHWVTRPAAYHGAFPGVFYEITVRKGLAEGRSVASRDGAARGRAAGSWMRPPRRSVPPPSTYSGFPPPPAPSVPAPITSLPLPAGEGGRHRELCLKPEPDGVRGRPGGRPP